MQFNNYIALVIHHRDLLLATAGNELEIINRSHNECSCIVIIVVVV